MEEKQEYTVEEKDPVKLRASLFRDMLLMRNLDISQRYEVKDVLTELNLRLYQYTLQFNTWSLDTLVIQTINDFNRIVKPTITVKNGKLHKEHSVAMQSNGELIFVQPSIVRSDFVNGIQQMFVYQSGIRQMDMFQKNIIEVDDGNGHEVVVPSDDDIPF